MGKDNKGKYEEMKDSEEEGENKEKVTEGDISKNKQNKVENKDWLLEDDEMPKKKNCL